MSLGESRKYAVRELERRRHSCVENDLQKKEEIYKCCPGLREIDTEIARAGTQLASAIIAGDGAAVRKQLAELDQKRTELLCSGGFTAEDLAPSHICNRCSDSGVLPNGTVCSCFQDLMHRHAAEKINSDSSLSLCRFDNFSLRYYSDQSEFPQEKSPRENMKEVLAFCKKYAESSFPGAPSLLMIGDAGLGKTHLALSIASRAIERGVDVVYCSAGNIFRQIEKEYFELGKRSDTLEELKHCDLLILDDLGVEFNNAFVNAALYDLVNTRIERRRATIYTTNLTDADRIAVRYGEKTSSRLVGCCQILPFFGEDIRLIRNHMN